MRAHWISSFLFLCSKDLPIKWQTAFDHHEEYVCVCFWIDSLQISNLAIHLHNCLDQIDGLRMGSMVCRSYLQITFLALISTTNLPLVLQIQLTTERKTNTDSDSQEEKIQIHGSSKCAVIKPELCSSKFLKEVDGNGNSNTTATTQKQKKYQMIQYEWNYKP